MSTFSLKSDGNIDVTRLEKDLRSALDFDTKYKQADNMKKRACKIATDYDEFKAFVACAHLKTVSRADITSLGTAKKGWLKSASSDKSSSALILSDELRSADRSDVSHSQVDKIKTPKTPMELERDLRKLSSVFEKNRYLARVGMKRVIKLLQADGNAELLEIIITILISSTKSDSVEGNTHVENSPVVVPTLGGTSIPLSGEKTDEKTDEKASPEIEIFDWLDAFTALNRFDLMIRFFSKEFITAIVQSLHDSMKDDAENVILKYRPLA